MENKVAIIGYGYVGKSTAFVLNISEKDCYNSKNKKQLISKIEKGIYNTFILCVPTPTVNKIQDISSIKEWLSVIKEKYPRDVSDPIVIIRSTILPGTTKTLSQKYGLSIVHVPEFLTEATAIEDEKNPEFLVIGADDILVREKVKELFLEANIYPKKSLLCNSVTAELIKYSLNSFFGLKVVFSNQIWDVAKKVNASYEKVVEILEGHKWGSKNGWNIWQGGFRGYGGHCLKKDIEAFSSFFNLPLLKEVYKLNEKLVKETK